MELIYWIWTDTATRLEPQLELLTRVLERRYPCGTGAGAAHQVVTTELTGAKTAPQPAALDQLVAWEGRVASDHSALGRMTTYCSGPNPAGGTTYAGSSGLPHQLAVAFTGLASPATGLA